MQTMDRTGFLGGSDAAAACGMSRFEDTYQLWLEKTGRVKRDEREEREELEWGKALEEPVALRYSQKNDRKVRRVNQAIVHPQYPFLRGHIDRTVERGDDKNAPKRILEIKTSGFRDEWGEVGSEDIPREYVAQCQFYMALAKADVCDVACLFWGRRYQQFELPFDKELADMLVEGMVDFWEKHVLTDVPPDPATFASAEHRWPTLTNKSRVATPEEIQMMLDLHQLTQNRLELERAEERFKAELRILAQHNEELIAPPEHSGGKRLVLLTINPQRSQRIDVDRLRDEEPEVAARFIKWVESAPLRITKNVAQFAHKEIAK